MPSCQYNAILWQSMHLQISNRRNKAFEAVEDIFLHDWREHRRLRLSRSGRHGQRGGGPPAPETGCRHYRCCCQATQPCATPCFASAQGSGTTSCMTCSSVLYDYIMHTFKTSALSVPAQKSICFCCGCCCCWQAMLPCATPWCAFAQGCETTSHMKGGGYGPKIVCPRHLGATIPWQCDDCIMNFVPHVLSACLHSQHLSPAKLTMQPMAPVSARVGAEDKVYEIPTHRKTWERSQW